MSDPTSAINLVRCAVIVRTPLLREGLALLIASHPSVAVGFVAADFDDRADVAVDAVVLAVDDPDIGRLITQHVRSRLPGARIVVCHDALPTHAIEVLHEAGADVLVDIASGEQAIVDAVIGSRSRTLRRWDRPTLGNLPLTDRERSVLGLLASGAGSRETGEALGISVHTVDHHKQTLFRKLDVANQAQAVATAIRLGLIDQPERVR